MKQYTTEWAKEYLREHVNAFQLCQDKNGFVWEYYEGRNIMIYKIFEMWDYKHGFSKYSTSTNLFVGKMLEHPDGWENSKVTREDL